MIQHDLDSFGLAASMGEPPLLQDDMEVEEEDRDDTDQTGPLPVLAAQEADHCHIWTHNPRFYSLSRRYCPAGSNSPIPAVRV